jgi:uncharacterized protein
VFDLASRRIVSTILASEGRHFYGHGCFSADGALLMATENAYATGAGKIGLYDARDGFRRVGEIEAGGIGPHDITLLPDGRQVIANGGVRTHPESGREPLNLETMQSNLTIIDGKGQNSSFVLDAPYRQNSIRHIAVASDGTIAFGCQWEGDPADAPPLIGLVSAKGSLRMLELPDDDLFALQNYIGSVAFSTDEETVIATAPRGNSAVLFKRDTGQFLKRIPMVDVCGVAALGHGAFLLSSGRDGVMRLDPSKPDGRQAGLEAARSFVWDNHIRAVEV